MIQLFILNFIYKFFKACTWCMIFFKKVRKLAVLLSLVGGVAESEQGIRIRGVNSYLFKGYSFTACWRSRDRKIPISTLR